MKLFLVTGIYVEAARALRERMPEGRQMDYGALYRLYSEASFGVSDRYTTHLEKLGWETSAAFGNDRFIQSKWAEENGVPASGPIWWLDILCEQIRRAGAETVFLLDLYRFDRGAREEIRRRCPAVKWIVGWRAAPMKEGEDFSDLDLFLSSLKGLVVEMCEKGIRAVRLGAGFDETLPQRLGKVEKDLGLTFCGSIGKENGPHSRRIGIISEVFRQTPMEVWSDSADVLEEPRKGILRRLFGRKRIHGGVYGLEMYRILGRSRMTLNVHIDMAGAEAVNMRLFEATGMGACLLTDNPKGIGEYFEVGTEVVGFEGVGDLLEKIAHLSAHPGEADEIAARGRARTLREHTLERRSQELHDLLLANLPTI